MQGDIIGCFLHMPDGGRPMEATKDVRAASVSAVHAAAHSDARSLV